jgi:signal transduction histidine kinase
MKRKIIMLMVLLHACLLLPMLAMAEEDDATKEEIIEMCKKAEELLLTNKDAGLAEIAKSDGQFVWKNTYVFLMDFDGNMLAHPMIPQLTEKGPLFHVADKNKEKPKMIFVEFVDIAKNNGEGWIWYKWPLPGSREPSDKFTYIRRVGFTDLLVGAGIYK